MMNTAPRTTHRHDGRPMWRTAAATAIAATLLIITGPAPLAQAKGFVDVPHTEAFFYGDFDAQIALFAGATAEDFCNGDEPTVTARLFTRHDGTTDLMFDADTRPIYLYSTPLGGPELIDATCAALTDGDPTTAPLQPFAVGEGHTRLRVQTAPDGTLHIVNSTVGRATTADGTTWQVRGWADLIIDENGPVGSPTDFQGLHFTRTGR